MRARSRHASPPEWTVTVLISAAEIAQLLGISEAAAWQRLHRAGLRQKRGYDPDEVAEKLGVDLQAFNPVNRKDKR
jgi:hypothetical protein